MNIVYSSSDSFCEIAGTSIVSLLENNKGIEIINIYVIDNSISDQNKSRLLELSTRYHRNLYFVSPIDLEKKAQTTINAGRWNISTFYRLFLCSILPTEVDRVIFLDCDVIVRKSLAELWNMPMQGKFVMGMDEFRGGAYRIELGMKEDDLYVNNGVLLIDLDLWRKNHVETDYLTFIHDRRGDITYADQGVLNGVLGKKHLTGELPPKYNAQTVYFDFSYQQLQKLRRPSRCCSLEEYNEAVNNPYIVHFTTCFLSGTRPWNTKCVHPMTNEFRKYKAMSPWSEEPLRPDDRKWTMKLMTIVCRCLPRNVMISGISIVHSKIYPFIRYIKTMRPFK